MVSSSVPDSNAAEQRLAVALEAVAKSTVVFYWYQVFIRRADMKQNKE